MREKKEENKYAKLLNMLVLSACFYFHTDFFVDSFIFALSVYPPIYTIHMWLIIDLSVY